MCVCVCSKYSPTNGDVLHCNVHTTQSAWNFVRLHCSLAICMDLRALRNVINETTGIATYPASECNYCVPIDTNEHFQFQIIIIQMITGGECWRTLRAGRARNRFYGRGTCPRTIVLADSFIGSTSMRARHANKLIDLPASKFRGTTKYTPARSHKKRAPSTCNLCFM